MAGPWGQAPYWAPGSFTSCFNYPIPSYQPPLPMPGLAPGATFIRSTSFIPSYQPSAPLMPGLAPGAAFTSPTSCIPSYQPSAPPPPPYYGPGPVVSSPTSFMPSPQPPPAPGRDGGVDEVTRDRRLKIFGVTLGKSQSKKTTETCTVRNAAGINCTSSTNTRRDHKTKFLGINYTSSKIAPRRMRSDNWDPMDFPSVPSSSSELPPALMSGQQGGPF